MTIEPRSSRRLEYRKGPIRLRGRQIPEKTTDERLLEWTGPETDWVHTDPCRVMRIQADNLTAIPLADSDRLRVGDFVVAVGNPFAVGQTVTSGIVSAVGVSMPPGRP